MGRCLIWLIVVAYGQSIEHCVGALKGRVLASPTNDWTHVHDWGVAVLGPAVLVAPARGSVLSAR